MKKFAVLFVALVFLLVTGASNVLFAQSSGNLVVRGYYVVVNGVSTGPYDAQGLSQLVSQGLLNRNTFVWREGMPSWVVAGTVSELAPMFGPEPPPPPPASPPPLIYAGDSAPDYDAQAAYDPEAASSSPAASQAEPPPPPSSYQTISTPRQTTTAASRPSGQSLLSAGGGVIWDFSLNNGIKDVISYQNNSIGAFGFFDATYVEADIYIAYGFISSKVGSTALGGSSASGFDGNLLQAGGAILGKYPFPIAPNITIFPLVGIDFNAVFLWIYKGKTETKDMLDRSQLGGLAGVGLDYYFTSSLFLRGEALFHLRLPEIGGFKDFSKYSLGLGPQVKVGVGYKF